MPPPYSTTNLTSHIDYSQNALLWKTVALSGAHPADGDVINGVEDVDTPSGNAWFGLSDTSGPVYETTVPNNLDSAVFTNTTGVTVNRLKSHDNSTNKALSDLISVSAASYFGIVMLTADLGSSANPIYSNQPMLFGAHDVGRFAVYQRFIAGQNYLCAWNDYNFGTGNEIQIAVDKNTLLVFAITHDASTFRFQVNKGTQQSTASGGATTELSGIPQFGLALISANTNWDGQIVEWMTYNAALTGSAYSQTYNYLLTKAGLLGGVSAGKGPGGHGKKSGGGGVHIVTPGGASIVNIGNPGLDIGST